MKITLPFRFTEEVIPYRCRNPRRVQSDACIRLTINEVSGTQAPIAVVQNKIDFDEDGKVSKKIVYRYWKGKLYTRTEIERYSHADIEHQTAEQFKDDPYPFHTQIPSYVWSYPYNVYESKQERRKKLMAWAKSILFIDGERWEVTGEPRYVVMTFGLGHNHGMGWGTSLSVDNHYNGNINRDRYFRVDQLDKAVEHATRIAIKRGDTKALPIKEQIFDTFDVLIPEALRLKPKKEHGTGDPFLNACENIIQQAGKPEAAMLGMSAVLGLMSQQ